MKRTQVYDTLKMPVLPLRCPQDGRSIEMRCVVCVGALQDPTSCAESLPHPRQRVSRPTFFAYR